MIGTRTGRDRLEDLGQPACGGLGPIDRRTAFALEPRPVLAQVVQQQASLALERDELGQPRQLAGVEPPARDGDPQPDRLTRRRRRQADLVDREPEVVEPPDPRPDRLAIAGRQFGHVVELGPQRRDSAGARSRPPRSRPRRHRPGPASRRGRRGRSRRSRRGCRGRTPRWPSDRAGWISLVSASTR